MSPSSRCALSRSSCRFLYFTCMSAPAFLISAVSRIAFCRLTTPIFVCAMADGTEKSPAAHTASARDERNMLESNSFYEVYSSRLFCQHLVKHAADAATGRLDVEHGRERRSDIVHHHIRMVAAGANLRAKEQNRHVRIVIEWRAMSGPGAADHPIRVEHHEHVAGALLIKSVADAYANRIRRNLAVH